ncbi:MAG: DUF2237 domain-containing protein [Pseudomonadota bacterium]
MSTHLPEPAKNIWGESLVPCSTQPMTGYDRTGYCHCYSADPGQHTVCAIMTREFLDYSLERGNDLITPRASSEFPGLKPGDQWCLCVQRWKEAFEAGSAPKVVLSSTHRSALKVVSLAQLKAHAIDLS